LDVEAAIRGGYADRYMWGSDYPHAEGTFQNPSSPDDQSNTKLALRFAFAGSELSHVEPMLGLNACQVYGFDVDTLSRVAENIGAPTFREISKPVAEEEIPEGAGRLYNQAFRRNGPFD
jgi:hypothetical protein